MEVNPDLLTFRQVDDGRGPIFKASAASSIDLRVGIRSDTTPIGAHARLMRSKCADVRHLVLRS
jgi:hypothetical protein